MSKKRSVFLILVLIFSSYSGLDFVYAHSMFNSAEQSLGDYRVQVATAPEFPQIDEPSQFLIKVTQGFEYEEVDSFTMGLRIYYNDQQVDAIPPTLVNGAHWDFDYTWKNIGNHIVKVDLYDMKDSDEILTYTFNMGTQSPFGIIFIAAITTGALVMVGVMLYIYIPRIFKKSKQ
ncbi:MAG: hypothetical protein HKO48_03710 [Nitrosopumilus sp.]|nr:hypothetical protein [Nitrosopumilus sp.]NNL37770.1 hypothetical protein [Nitrosopumilus sp.]NNM36204.1 hypothetical protein [Nitrosopumilus sp.]